LWIEKQPDNARAYYWRGWVLERLNNSKIALQDYEKALELDPGFVEVRLRVVEMLIEDKLAPDAMPHLELLIQQAPNNPQVKARLGMCRFLEGRTDEARRLMEEAVVHLTNDPMLLVSLANLDLQQDRAADAERRLRTVLDADPSDTEALFVLVSALQMLGKVDESKAMLEVFEKKRKTVERINELLRDADEPTTTPAQLAEIGELFLSINRNKHGVYWLERALERGPTNQQARRILVEHYEKVGRPEDAAEHRRFLRDVGPQTGNPPVSR
jgi:tetratricopeptide (TPR) repeat protein